MRRFAALPTCLGLLAAFLVAPFEHVHTGHGADHDHDHPGLIHAHFYNVAASHEAHHGPEFEEPDDDHAAVWSLDTFTLELTAGLSPFIPSRELSLVFIPSVSFSPVAVVEECGHDPPSVDRSIPRAPPS